MNGKRVVVDASLAVKWLVNEEATEAAVRLLERWSEEEVRVSAPCLLFTEVANALYKRVRRKEMDLADARTLLSSLNELGIEVEATKVLAPRALELAARFGCPATYDAMYVALAEALACEFWTADERLYNTVKAQCEWVHWLGEESLRRREEPRIGTHRGNG
ncbi:MAG: type II toxin-antitoxin system VapC family toxin [Desulfotomaculales bacterium]